MADSPTPRSSWPLRLPLRVRFHECDPQAIVFNANYLAYFDMASYEVWRAVCGSYQEMVAQGLDVVVAESHLRFLRPARYDDELDVLTAVDHLGTTSLVLAFEIRRREEIITLGTIRYVFVSAETMTKIPPPDDVRAALEALR